MRRFFVPLMIVCVLLLPSGIAQATPPSLASGTYVTWIVDITVVREVGGNTFLTIIKEGNDFGTTMGHLTETENVVVGKHINTFHGVQTCDPCNVGGRLGTYVLRYEGTEDQFGHHRGVYVILSGTGDLANLHGQGTFDGYTASDGTNSGTYSGQFHFDP
jgi:hypothetical protein